MRDPNRIDMFCARIAAAWKENCPDMRFGQFIMNAFGDLGKDPFFPEDDEMIGFIEKWAQNNSPYHKPPEENGIKVQSEKKSCRAVVLSVFPDARVDTSGPCTADIFGSKYIHCDDWRNCEECWDSPAPKQYQKEK